MYAPKYVPDEFQAINRSAQKRACPFHISRSEGWGQKQMPAPSCFILTHILITLQKQLAEEQIASDLIVELLKKETAALEDEQV